MGWADADQAMRELWGELDNRGEPVPPALKQYMRDLVNPHQQERRHVPGTKKVTNVLQDLSIVLLADDAGALPDDCVFQPFGA